MTDGYRRNECMPPSSTRWLYLSAGWVVLGLAVLGIFLPVLPTTPLVLLAAWCFSRSSKRLHRWLLDHPSFGPLVGEWEAHSVIPMPAKILATAMVIPLVGYAVLFDGVPGWARIPTALLVAWGMGFVWTKPSRPGRKRRGVEGG